jgi:hypothetical protein
MDAVICPACLKIIPVGLYFASPLYCSCGAAQGMLLSTSTDFKTTIVQGPITSSGNTTYNVYWTEAPKRPVSVPQAFYDAFTDEEVNDWLN